MKNLKRWIAIILAVVIVVGASTVFVDHKLKASETNGDTTAQEQQEVAEKAGKEVEVVVPPIAESEPVVIPEEPAEEPIEEIPEEPAEEPVEEIPEEPAEEPVEEIAEEPAEEPVEEIAEEPTEEIPEEPAEEIAEEVWEDIVIRSASIKVPSYIYSADETASAELVLKIENEDGVNINNFVIELTKVNSTETTVSDLVFGMTALEGKLMNGAVAFEYKFDFVPFDGENETASLKVVIKDTDEEETVLAIADATFEKKTEEIINEPEEDIEETTTEEIPEEPAVEPTEEIIEEPVEEPAEEIAEEPAEEPAEEIPEEPVEEPTEEIVEEPVEEPTEEIAEEPVEEPTEEIAEEPTEEPTEEIVEEPVEEPAEEIAEEPTEEPAEEIAEEPTEEPAEEIPEVPAEPTFGVTYDKDPRTLADGDSLTMIAVITGLDDVEYVVIWQTLVDGEWVNVEGAIGNEFTIIVSPETRGSMWRYIVESV